jgi:hypothetical protein
MQNEQGVYAPTGMKPGNTPTGMKPGNTTLLSAETLLGGARPKLGNSYVDLRTGSELYEVILSSIVPSRYWVRESAVTQIRVPCPSKKN